MKYTTEGPLTELFAGQHQIGRTFRQGDERYLSIMESTQGAYNVCNLFNSLGGKLYITGEGEGKTQPSFLQVNLLSLEPTTAEVVTKQL
jgi:hypothetical protein